MAVLTNEQIGRLVELVAAKDLSRPIGGQYRRPLFRATLLGDKYPTVDFLVDVLGRNDISLGFFIVQVKGTVTGLSTGARLSVAVSRDRFNLLVRLPAPTYLIGVDVIAETSYLVAAHKPRKTQVSSITKAYSLRDHAVKIKLYKEVLAFWKANKPILQQTQFKDV
jgi:hypothetical protein